ncbi:MAG: S41 family peptidase [Acidobacteriota bacterium]|nr:S41 family peptidase [Acidobacteriota bacterium]
MAQGISSISHPRKSKSLLALSVLTTVCLLTAIQTVIAQPPPSRPVSFAETLRRASEKTANKLWSEAIPLWEKIAAANPVNGDFWVQLANARYNAKDYKGAIADYEKAFELRAGRYYNSAYNIAACYALLGDKQNALAWLEKSLGEGFPNLEAARNDADLQSLRDDARFKKLVGAEDTTKMSREEGWRYDVSLLAREIKRVAKQPFAATSEQDFDTAVNSLLNRIPQFSDLQIEIELRKIVALLGRSHSILLNGKPDKDAFEPLPIQTYFFDEGLFIIAADAKHADLVGAQILSWGGHTPDEILNALNPLISQTNKYRALRIAPELLRGTVLPNALGLNSERDKVVLSIRGLDGKTRTVTLDADRTLQGYGDVPPPSWTLFEQTVQKPLPLYLKNRTTNLWFEFVPETKTMYVAVNNLRNDPKQPAADFFAQVFKVVDEREIDKLVIDLRWCNGGDTTNAQPLIEGIIRRDKINRKGKLFVVVGRQTFSAAINAAVLLERNTNSIFAGEPTGDSPNFVGETNVVTLPYSKSRAIISNLYWQMSSPQDARRWIAPTLYAPPTFESFRENRDPAMEAILAY